MAAKVPVPTSKAASRTVIAAPQPQTDRISLAGNGRYAQELLGICRGWMEFLRSAL
jgi:hypothetical protein